MIANECPLCQGNLDNLYHKRKQIGCSEGYRLPKVQYECTACKHGWSITTLQQVAYMGLAGKTFEEIRKLILEEDADKERGETSG